MELTYGWFLVSIIKLKRKLLKEENRHFSPTKRLILQSVAWSCRQGLFRVSSYWAVKFFFWKNIKEWLEKQVHLLQEAIKKKENNRLEYKWGGFVIALQDPVKAIRGLTDRSGLTHSAGAWWCFHEVSLCFSSPGLRSPRSNPETSKTSEPRIVQWRATVCCGGVLKPLKYFRLFLFAATETVADIILHKERSFSGQ